MTAAAAGAGTSEIRCCAVAAVAASEGLGAVTEGLRCFPHPRHRPSNWHAFEAGPRGCFDPGRKAETSGAEQGQAWSQSQLFSALTFLQMISSFVLTERYIL